MARRASLRTLDNKLWKVFSEYIRRKDADIDGNVTCITCYTKKHWKQMDAGHFVSRNAKAIKYDERNVHAQCKSCNGFHGGMSFVYGQRIDVLYGAGTAEDLEAQRHSISGWTTSYLEALIEEYKTKLSKLDRKRG